MVRCARMASRDRSPLKRYPAVYPENLADAAPNIRPIVHAAAHNIRGKSGPAFIVAHLSPPRAQPPNIGLAGRSSPRWSRRVVPE